MRRSAVKRLTFKRAYLPLIAAGKKTQTIRRWKKPKLRAGDVVLIPNIGTAEVISVEPVELADLDENDAECEGFASLGALIKALRSIYSDVGPFWRVRFRLLPRDVPNRRMLG